MRRKKKENLGHGERKGRRGGGRGKALGGEGLFGYFFGGVKLGRNKIKTDNLSKKRKENLFK